MRQLAEQLMDLSFKDFVLRDAHGNTPSDISRRFNSAEVTEILEKYEAVYNRSQLMKTNYERSGAGLPFPIEVQRVNIASFLTPREFGYFTATTNTHINRDEQHEENTETDQLTINPVI